MCCLVLMGMIANGYAGDEGIYKNFIKDFKGGLELIDDAHVKKSMPMLTFETPMGTLTGHVIRYGRQDVTVIYAPSQDHTLYFFRTGTLEIEKITATQIKKLKADSSNRFVASGVDADTLNTKYVKKIPVTLGGLFSELQQNKTQPVLDIVYRHPIRQTVERVRTPLFDASHEHVFYLTSNVRMNILKTQDILYVGLPVG